jgi:hypothetical protein
LAEKVRANAEHLAAEAGLRIEFIRRLRAFRKEDRIQAILAERGDHPGLVHIFSAREACSSYQPWHDKTSGRTLLKPDTGKCLLYYFYFIDEQFGLCYMRVPTWAPFRLQVYFNGHSWLARQLHAANIPFAMADNAFAEIGDWQAAQRLADSLDAQALHPHLDGWAQRVCPVLAHFRAGCHWSFMQAEYATDVVFGRQAHQPRYQAIGRAYRRARDQGRACRCLPRAQAHRGLPGRNRQRLLHPHPRHPHPPPDGAGQPQALRQVWPHRPDRDHRQ